MSLPSFTLGRLVRALPLLALVLGGCVASEVGGPFDGDDVAYVSPPDCAKKRDDGRVCLACNIYFESRGEPFEGQVMVARVTLNRVKHHSFPGGICEVLWQRGQFSWTFDRHPDRPRERGGAWLTALKAADVALKEVAAGKTAYPYLYFHATYIRKARKGAARVIGRHIFFTG